MEERTRIFEQRLAELRSGLRQAEANLVAVTAEKTAVESAHADLLNSRSWRLTAPLRWFVLRLRGVREKAAAWNPAAREQDVIEPGLAGLPSLLRRPQSSSIGAVNSTCRLIDLSPGLEGLLPDQARQALQWNSVTDDNYLGWHPAPPAIGFIGSGELRTELAFDARIVDVDEADWETVLVSGSIQFLLVETVWHAGHGRWRYVLTRAPGQEEGTFQRIVAHCRKINLPIVLWFREVPSNCDQFSWLVELADIVYVADIEVADCLRREHPRARIENAPPAIQPALHNPLRSSGMEKAADAFEHRIVFDGWWDLQADPQLRRVLEAVKEHGLLVAESEWDFSGIRLADGPELADYVIGCLNKEEKTVLDKMAGGRVFISNPLAGYWRSALNMLRAVGGRRLVAWLDGGPVRTEAWMHDIDVDRDVTIATLASMLADPLACARQAHLAWRRTMQAHTYAHRLQKMADDLSLKTDFLATNERIACLLVTMRPDRLGSCIERFRRDAYPEKELIVVVNDDTTDLRDAMKHVREGEPIRIFRMASSLSLGACLNFAFAQTDAHYWIKMDDDDFYGENYLSDIMLYQRLGSFDVFGKPPMFNYLEGNDELMWDPNWAKYENVVHEAQLSSSALVAGGTIGGRRHVLESLAFSEARRGGSDSDFIRRCYEAGFDVLSMDGFNFARFRSAQQGFHTWQIHDDDIRLRSVSVGGIAAMDKVAMV